MPVVTYVRYAKYVRHVTYVTYVRYVRGNYFICYSDLYKKLTEE